MSLLRSILRSYKKKPKTPSEILLLVNRFANESSIEAGEEAAILLSPNTDQFFNDLDLSAKNILREISNNTLMISRTTADDHGTQWIVLKSEDFGALVKGIDHFSTSIADKGLGSQMIAAVFKGTIENKDSYWICNYRTASYYPFVPIGKRERDFDREIILSGIFKHHRMPVEPTENWYSLWDSPF